MTKAKLRSRKVDASIMLQEHRCQNAEQQAQPAAGWKENSQTRSLRQRIQLAWGQHKTLILHPAEGSDEHSCPRASRQGFFPSNFSNRQGAFAVSPYRNCPAHHKCGKTGRDKMTGPAFLC
ncbi:hypothetical protein CB1_000154025 [Camelus ferus]|nr:hypothetical protein CB1_000154025 [Camelus ferus]